MPGFQALSVLLALSVLPMIYQKKKTTQKQEKERKNEK
jgi:hypothetical protein